ncbi:MAG: plasmid recombination protein [Bacilli bacterium]|nr:plasmid recombination protein [Bacilli bacterium]
MYDGNQVLRFESKYKSADLGGLGIELVQRKGTGNYDQERTIFNYSYVPLSKPTLQEQVYSKLKDNKIYYNDGKNTNLLNGAIVTSGKEFFQSLGMKFKASDRTHQVGKDKGKPILVPDIKSDDDIPGKVKEFFNDSYNFLENLVGKDNVIYAQVHYDEDTPHLHFYFMPIVNEVKRKVFETDNNGNIIYREGIDKKGNKKMYPVQKKDKNEKNIFKTETGKFLNCDQFWKSLGGKTSYAKIQDDYNKYITEKGYHLFRGNIGDNKHHKTKAEKEIEYLNEQIEEMKIEFEKNKKLNDIELQTSKEISEFDTNEILNPVKRKVIGYKDEDINNLIDYSKQIQKENSSNKNAIKQKDVLLEELTQKLENLQSENDKLKDGRAIKERDTKIYEQAQTISNQKSIIKEKNSIIEKLESTVDELQATLAHFKEKMFNFCDKICRALGHKIGIHLRENSEINYDDMEYYANGVNRKYERPEKDKSDDMEISM